MVMSPGPMGQPPQKMMMGGNGPMPMPMGMPGPGPGPNMQNFPNQGPNGQGFAAAQMEWQKMQHEFYEERRRKVPGGNQGPGMPPMGTAEHFFVPITVLLLIHFLCLTFFISGGDVWKTAAVVCSTKATTTAVITRTESDDEREQSAADERLESVDTGRQQLKRV
jgi:hypothetical protein